METVANHSSCRAFISTAICFQLFTYDKSDDWERTKSFCSPDRWLSHMLRIFAVPSMLSRRDTLKERLSS